MDSYWFCPCPLWRANGRMELGYKHGNLRMYVYPSVEPYPSMRWRGRLTKYTVD